MRKVVTRVAEGKDGHVEIDAKMLRELLGKPRYGYREELEERTDRPGVATGLAWTPFGGEVLYVEATQMPGSKGFQYTGQLGEVMQESARIAMSVVRAKAQQVRSAGGFLREARHSPARPGGRGPERWPVGGRDDGRRRWRRC